MEPEPTTLTYQDLQRFPDDNLRRELLGGELVVTPAPGYPHQWTVAKLLWRIFPHAARRGGRVLAAPFDLRFSDTDVVEPDLVYAGPERAVAIQEEGILASPPDLVVEVSSPSTRQLELVRKRDLYERFQVPEYWVVDLDAQRIELYRLEAGRYGLPRLLGPGDVLTSSLIPGLELAVGEILSLESA